MLSAQRLGRLMPYGLMALLFYASWLFRPLLPVDETRYLSVAWEMFARQSFLVPTLNFEPYFQKPPLLFWLIDLSWAAFGVSRVAAMAVIFAISSLVIFLTGRLAVALFPNVDGLSARMPWLMLGSVAFVIYSSLILFDLLLAASVLGCFLALIALSNRGQLRYAILAGLCIGLGVLAKGPVVLLHVAFPILMYPLWRQPVSSLPPGRFFARTGLALLIAAAVVATWLVPALHQVGGDFAYRLVWEQSAGRVAGTAPGAHARPFYFYLVLLPVALLPWGLSPGLWATRPWRRLREGGDVSQQDFRVLAFLTAWCIGDLLVFSAISGKQPHYLVPLLPVVAIMFGYFMTNIRLSAITGTAVFVVAISVIGQAIASDTILYRYDLSPVAEFVAANRGSKFAFAGRYQGELTFLARMDEPFEILSLSDVDAWLRTHPTGYLITKVRRYPDLTESVAYSQLVKNGYLVVLNGNYSAEANLR
jgi:4-amino-4-deoxy-L-arabinose transferase-like glycosyltransferase